MALTKLAGAFLARPTLFIVGAIAAAVTLACITAVALYEMRLDAFARARDAADNLSLILQRDIERNIEVYELSIQAAIDGVNDPAILRLPPQIRQRVLFDRSTNAKDMGSLLVTNSAGDVVIDSQSAPPESSILVTGTTSGFNSSRPMSGFSSANHSHRN